MRKARNVSSAHSFRVCGVLNSHDIGFHKGTIVDQIEHALGFDVEF